MGSSRGQDRSLGTGLSLPQWMKARMDSRCDFDQSSFSPPSHDDNFFYIRYPRLSETSDNSGSSNQEVGYRPISQVLTEKTIKPSGAVISQASGQGGGGGISLSGPSTTISSNIKDIKNIDFSKHPLPCQPFVPSAGGEDIKPAVGAIASKIKSGKSQGTDDGFHGEPALCGKSIVHVAHRIMSKKVLKKIETEGETNESKIAMEKNNHEDDVLRKGSSKSLPVTPIASPISTPDTSPKSRRKLHSNRYFTGVFTPDCDKYQAGWILSSILRQSREVMNNRIQEEEEEASAFDSVPSKFLNRKKSISSQNLSYLGKDDTRNVFPSTTATAEIPILQHPEQQQQQQQPSKQTSVYTNVFQAKSSELREMNFWSPTSM